MYRLDIFKGLVALATLLLTASAAFAQDALKLAIGQRGAWETSISELGQTLASLRSTVSLLSFSIPRAPARLDLLRRVAPDGRRLGQSFGLEGCCRSQTCSPA
jgi:hypothetical protein